MAKTRLYVGCALNSAPEGFKSSVLALRSKLAGDPRFEVLEFLGSGGTPEDVYRKDIMECVESADIMLAVCDHPSLGLGFEMATHVKKNKRPLLAVAHMDSNVSRLVIGIHGEGPYAFKRYRDLFEASLILDEWLRDNPSFLRE